MQPKRRRVSVPYSEHAEGGFRVLLCILRANALFRLTGHAAVRAAALATRAQA